MKSIDEIIAAVAVVTGVSIADLKDMSIKRPVREVSEVRCMVVAVSRLYGYTFGKFTGLFYNAASGANAADRRFQVLYDSDPHYRLQTKTILENLGFKDFRHLLAD